MSNHPFLDAPRPHAFAHRGGALEAPENTLPAFDAAIALGYGYLETDIQLTRDGVLVAFHDPTLDRVTDGSGRIAELTVAEVRAADAGFRFTSDGSTGHPFRGRGVTVPTLEELLLRWPEARVNVDPKSDACVEPLVQLILRLDATGRVCIGSFFDRRITRVRALSGGRICTSMGSVAVAAAWAASRAGYMPRLNAACIQVPVRSRGVRIVDAAFIRAAHRARLLVHVWTVNTTAEMEALLDLGVDGVMTDRPSLLRSLLQQRVG